MAHFTCVGATVGELTSTLDRMRELGLDNVLALRGDPPQDQETWTKTEGGLEYSRELVELIGARYGEFSVGAACFPETHIHATSPEDDLRHLKAKVDAGVDFLITQLFFDNAFYYDFVDRARAAGVDVPIIPGIMPITNARQIQRVTSLCKSEIPDRLRAELDARADDPDAAEAFGVAYATLQCADLLAHGAPGIHFYTMNRSPATRAILSALKLLRPWERGGALTAGAVG
jgi:methylenetetrahydrofolate reductase (NADPH)